MKIHQIYFIFTLKKKKPKMLDIWLFKWEKVSFLKISKFLTSSEKKKMYSMNSFDLKVFCLLLDLLPSMAKIFV